MKNTQKRTTKNRKNKEWMKNRTNKEWMKNRTNKERMKNRTNKERTAPSCTSKKERTTPSWTSKKRTFQLRHQRNHSRSVSACETERIQTAPLSRRQWMRPTTASHISPSTTTVQGHFFLLHGPNGKQPRVYYNHDPPDVGQCRNQEAWTES